MPRSYKFIASTYARRIAVSAVITAFGVPALAATCGGSFNSFVQEMSREAAAQGLPSQAISTFFAGAKQDPRVLRADRAQGVFQKPFDAFSQSVISRNRLQNGAAKLQAYRNVFDRVESSSGVSRGVLAAFWGLETDFGAVQGDLNTRNALVTLAHDCRRPELFQPQVLAGIALTARGDFDPARTTGAWAGEIGQVQMLPADLLRNGVDGDGDGHVDLKGSSPDALMSGGKMLSELGWRRGEPWMQEVIVPDGLDWSKTGIDSKLSGAEWAKRGVTARSGQLYNLPSSILLPMGRKGPAFIVYPNFNVLFEWNKSFVYVTTAAYFATRLEGAPPYNLGSPDPALSPNQMQALQTKLRARGHDVGAVDGILGALTRNAVQREQARLGMPADAWPTKQLLDSL
ncbi:lytic murein transglycosylase [Albirhodobacter sp. R86504]|uniref:lytic murein transglycosylase n=1 Tax=Albirhodobacter sp. R86504 TaxID=3093848 RepID=UPI003670B07F